ncbi:DUF5723 family protein [Carboxylicivirga marina]|uniref:DUF5723 family protein n=1 Tax=Carboxylicivirga marina TaxID=2800988 RepID=UPI002596EB0B|nr:DUF5723 family protein [uncultured Carboxylicivirga sp.]
MRRVLFFILIIYTCLCKLESQEFIGVHTSQYLPFVNLIYQPANLTRDTAKWNFNFLSTNVALLNSQVFATGDIWDGLAKVGFEDLKYFLASEESLLYVKGRLIAPSLTFKLNDRHSFALSTSVRADGVYSSSNDDFLKIFSGISQPDALKDINDEYFKSLVNSWVEYSLSWSTTILRDENNWLTGGANLKILNGAGSGYLEMDGVDVMFDDESISHFDMQFSYGFNESLSKTIDGGDIIEQSGNMGIGLDLGLEYAYLPDYLIGVDGAPYKYKIGFVISDIGHINHPDTKNQASYNVSMENVPYSRFKGIQTIEALKDSIEKSIDFEENKGGSFRTKLPLSMVFNFDYCITPGWFVNGSVMHRPNYYTATVNILNKGIWRYTITPRYEKQKWGAYLPFDHNSVLGWNIGIAGRYRQFFLGSSTFVGNLFGIGRGQMLVYFGVSVPIGSL